MQQNNTLSTNAVDGVFTLQSFYAATRRLLAFSRIGATSQIAVHKALFFCCTAWAFLSFLLVVGFAADYGKNRRCRASAREV